MSSLPHEPPHDTQPDVVINLAEFDVRMFMERLEHTHTQTN